MMDWRRKRELIDEIKYSFPSKRMIEVVSIGAVEFKGKLIIIKSRYEKRDMPRMVEQNPYIRYDKFQPMLHDYKEILAKNVIFDIKLLSRRGLIALLELAENMDMEGDIVW